MDFAIIVSHLLIMVPEKTGIPVMVVFELDPERTNGFKRGFIENEVFDLGY